MQTHLAQIEGYGTERVYGEVEGDVVIAGGPTRPVDRLAAGLGRFASRSARALPRLQAAELHAAGIYSKDLDVIEGYRYLAAAAAGLLVLLYAVVLTGKFSAVIALAALAFAGLGWEVPALLIRRRGRNRLRQIDRQLPDLIDLLVASVEAGLGVGASMALLAGRFEGPLGEELRLVLRQQQLGTSSAAALLALSERADTTAVRAFARTLVRADAMGGSVGPVLRNLAGDARRRRGQQAREHAAKVPIKLLFPLVLLIFPSLFVVLLYPAVYTIVRQFGG
jgi:tight adherence protein C